MAKRLDVYKCEICGHIIEVLHEGGGTLVCCGQPMKYIVENTVDASKEKHIPVIEETPSGVKVKVGSIPHPMEDKHYIEWIQIVTDHKACRHFLKPGENPECSFEVPKSSILNAREYCNLHYLWKGM